MTLTYSDELRRRGGSSSSGGAKWVTGLLLTLALAALFAALVLYLASSESTAIEADRRAVNALAEGDAIIVRGYDDLVARAETVDPTEPVFLSDWPVNIALTTEEVLQSTPESLRALLLDRSADKLYQDGAAEAFRSDEAASSPGRFSAAGVVEALLDLLREDVHTAALISMIVLGIVAGTLTAILLASTRGYGRLVAIGLCVTAAALPVLLGGLALSAYMDAASGSDYLRDELAAIGADLASLPVQVGGALLLAGVAVAVLGAVAAKLSDRRSRAVPRTSLA